MLFVGARHQGALLTHVERKSLFNSISELFRSTGTHRATIQRLNPLHNQSSLPRPIMCGNAG